MTDKELHYVTYDPDAVWDEMQYAYVQAGGDILYPGDEKEMLLRGVQASIIQIFAGVDNALRMATLRYAVGEYLDVIGESRNCPRIAAVAATAKVKVTGAATGSVHYFAAGTLMTADGIVFYALDSPLVTDGTAKDYNNVAVTCQTPGIVGNQLVANAAMHLATANSSISAITVTTAASGGRNEETDDVYRERIRLHGLTEAGAGTKSRYEAAARAVSTDIKDVAVFSFEDSQHTGVYKVNISVALDEDMDPTETAAILTAVAQATSVNSGVRALTDQLNINSGIKIVYSLVIGYTCDEGVVSAAELEAVAEEWQAAQDYKFGKPFNPEKLIAALYQAGATRAVIDETSWFHTSGTDAEYTEIDEDEYCVGTVTLSEITD